jgi:lysozyme family protein
LNYDLADQLFDMNLNAGKGTSTRMIQGLCVAYGKNIAIDGGFGANTYGAVASLNQSELVKNFKICRKAYYNNLIERDPTQEVWRNGWYNRIGGGGEISSLIAGKYNDAMTSVYDIPDSFVTSGAGAADGVSKMSGVMIAALALCAFVFLKKGRSR